MIGIKVAAEFGQREAPSLKPKHGWAAAGDGVAPVTQVVKEIIW